MVHTNKNCYKNNCHCQLTNTHNTNPRIQNACIGYGQLSYVLILFLRLVLKDYWTPTSPNVDVDIDIILDNG